MWFWLISTIVGSILGNAADSWFSDTKFGGWVYRKIDQLGTWAADKLNIKILKDEELWKYKYPNIIFSIHSVRIIGKYNIHYCRRNINE